MTIALLALAVAGLTVLVTGCASDSPDTAPLLSPPPPSVDLAGPTRPPEGSSPRLAFDKLSVDFGAVAQDQQGVATFLVINKGDSQLKVGPVSIEAEQGCDTAKTVGGDVEVQPGEVTLLPVWLGPHRKLGPHRLLVNVESNDPARSMATLAVDFTVAQEETPPRAGPRLRVDKETIDAGIVPFDWPLYEQFTLRNAGDASLVLEDAPFVRVEDGC